MRMPRSRAAGLPTVRWRGLVGVLILGGLRISVVAAQTIDVGTLVSYYRPFGRFDPASIYVTSLPTTPSELAGVGWGATAHLGLRRRFGIEGFISEAQSSIAIGVNPAGFGGSTPARVTIAALQGQYDVSPAPERYRLWLEAGPALVQHGGDAYSHFGSPPSVGSARGTRCSVPLISHLQLTAGLQTLWYTFDLAMPAELRANPGPLQHGPQRDLSVDVGLGWRLR
jgi:hypothetical protein